MLRLISSRFLWGGLLVLIGLLLLLQNLLDIQFGGLIWAILLGLAGLFFIAVFITNRQNWWALIPGFTLLGIALEISVDSLFSGLGGVLDGSFVLGGIGIGFLAVYLQNRQFWWAMIPAGVMLTLAIGVALEDYLGDDATAGFFLIGFGLTFAVIALLPPTQGSMKWAWIPAGVLFLVGAVLLGASENLLVYVVPALLIAGGGVLILRTLRRT